MTELSATKIGKTEVIAIEDPNQHRSLLKEKRVDIHMQYSSSGTTLANLARAYSATAPSDDVAPLLIGIQEALNELILIGDYWAANLISPDLTFAAGQWAAGTPEQAIYFQYYQAGMYDVLRATTFRTQLYALYTSIDCDENGVTGNGNLGELFYRWGILDALRLYEELHAYLPSARDTSADSDARVLNIQIWSHCYLRCTRYLNCMVQTENSLLQFAKAYEYKAYAHLLADAVKADPRLVRNLFEIVGPSLDATYITIEAPILSNASIPANLDLINTALMSYEWLTSKSDLNFARTYYGHAIDFKIGTIDYPIYANWLVHGSDGISGSAILIGSGLILFDHIYSTYLKKITRLVNQKFLKYNWKGMSNLVELLSSLFVTVTGKDFNGLVSTWTIHHMIHEVDYLVGVVKTGAWYNNTFLGNLDFDVTGTPDPFFNHFSLATTPGLYAMYGRGNAEEIMRIWYEFVMTMGSYITASAGVTGMIIGYCFKAVVALDQTGEDNLLTVVSATGDSETGAYATDISYYGANGLLSWNTDGYYAAAILNNRILQNMSGLAISYKENFKIQRPKRNYESYSAFIRALLGPLYPSSSKPTAEDKEKIPGKEIAQGQ